jgi:hypothetical protein
MIRGADDGGSTHVWNVGSFHVTTQCYIPEDSKFHWKADLFWPSENMAFFIF